MKAWCEQCGRYIDYKQEVSRPESIEIKGTRFNVMQTFGICPVCGDSVLSSVLTDKNIHKAHNAYRRALNSITAEEIQAILDQYNIGAQPLGLLLGWGPNTISRQLKHTIPDKEHANRLKALRDPRNMMQLLCEHGRLLKAPAYKKAMAATTKLLAADFAPALNSLTDLFQAYTTTLTPLKSFFAPHRKLEVGKGNLNCEGSTKNAGVKYDFAFAGRKS